MSKSSHVVVTGSAGRLGKAAVAGLLAAGHVVTGFDRVPTPGLPPGRSLVGDIANRADVERALAGATCVIHLAATPDDAKRPDGSIIYDPAHFPDHLLPANVLGSYHVLDVARALKVPNVVLASSGQVIDGHLEAKRIPVKADVDYQPLYLYACTKVMLEQMGRVYSRHHGLNVLAVRLGWCPRHVGQVKEIAADPEAQDVYLSPGDAGRFFAACAGVTLPNYGVCYVTSRHAHTLTYDLSDAKQYVNWEPTERWPAGAEAY